MKTLVINPKPQILLAPVWAVATSVVAAFAAPGGSAAVAAVVISLAVGLVCC